MHSCFALVMFVAQGHNCEGTEAVSDRFNVMDRDKGSHLPKMKADDTTNILNTILIIFCVHTRLARSVALMVCHALTFASAASRMNLTYSSCSIAVFNASKCRLFA